jgi:hypothetical protein
LRLKVILKLKSNLQRKLKKRVRTISLMKKQERLEMMQSFRNFMLFGRKKS